MNPCENNCVKINYQFYRSNSLRSGMGSLMELMLIISIAALLSVGALSMRSVLDVARASATAEEFQNYSMAHSVFKNAYGVLAGDAKMSEYASYTNECLPGAAGSDAAKWDGNEDGSVLNGESVAYWCHMRASEIVRGKLDASVVTLPASDGAASTIKIASGYDLGKNTPGSAKIGGGYFLHNLNASSDIGLLLTKMTGSGTPGSFVDFFGADKKIPTITGITVSPVFSGKLVGIFHAKHEGNSIYEYAQSASGTTSSDVFNTYDDLTGNCKLKSKTDAECFIRKLIFES